MPHAWTLLLVVLLSGTFGCQSRWERVEPGMTRGEVRALVGEPAYVYPYAFGRPDYAPHEVWIYAIPPEERPELPGGPTDYPCFTPAEAPYLSVRFDPSVPDEPPPDWLVTVAGPISGGCDVIVN
ncbi:MAG TPA: hypothetical protein VF594_09440 [Rubricoccaceae bacterium]